MKNTTLKKVIKKGIFGTKYSKMEQLKFLEDSLKKIWGDTVCLSRFFKGSLPQISLGPFYNTLSHLV